MTNIQKNGTLNISSDVLVSIVEIAINEVEGAQTHEISLTDKIKKNNAVKVAANNKNELTVDASISVKHGIPIHPLVAEIQDNIKSSIETMTSFTVKTINVSVVSIDR